MIYNLTFIILFLLGLYAIYMGKNLIKMVIGINIMEASIFFWVIAMGNNGGMSPIVQPGNTVELFNDPVPQALVLTGIVIGASTTALLLTFAIELNKLKGSIKPEEVKGLND